MSLHRRRLLLQLSTLALLAPWLPRRAEAETTTYTYDALGRVTGVAFSSGESSTYTYDAAGNRTQVTRNGPPTFNQTIQVTGVGPVNLRSLANSAGYNGAQPATVIFQVGSAVTVLNGLDTGTWPSSSYAISLTLQVSGKVYGYGGAGGTGAGTTSGAGGGAGGDAIACHENISITVNSGGQVKGGGGGGGGGGAWQLLSHEGETTFWNGGGGGGGFPNGAGGAAGAGDINPSSAGSVGTTGGGGAGGAGGTASGSRVNGAGGAGGGAASAGADGSVPTGSGGAGLGTWSTTPQGFGGAAGYAIRKNGKTVTVTNNGTITGTQA